MAHDLWAWHWLPYSLPRVLSWVQNLLGLLNKLRLSILDGFCVIMYAWLFNGVFFCSQFFSSSMAVPLRMFGAPFHCSITTCGRECMVILVVTSRHVHICIQTYIHTYLNAYIQKYILHVTYILVHKYIHTHAYIRTYI